MKKESLDVLLINPPMRLSLWESKLGSKLPPIGLASLAAYLRKNQFSVKIFDAFNQGLNVQEVIKYIKTASPRYLGLTASTNIINDAVRLAKEVKINFPEIKIILGGPHISALPEETMRRFPCFDIGIFGEGELTLAEIIEKGAADRSIDGVVFREGTDIVKTEKRQLIKNLDDLPFPAYDLIKGFPADYRPTPNNYLNLPVASVVSSRGCPYSCSFCSQSIFGNQWRTFSVEYLVSMIEHLKKEYGIKEVCFYDDIFLVDQKKLGKFISLMKVKKLNVKWSCEGRIDQFNDELLSDMKSAGCWQISFGIESGSQEILDDFNKKIDLVKIKTTIRAAKKAGINSRAYLIIGAPHETAATLKETEDLALSLPLDDLHISFFTPWPGSEAYHQVVGKESVEDYSKMDQYKIFCNSEDVNGEELFQFMNKLYRKFYFHPARLLRYFCMAFNPHKTVHLIRSFVLFIKLTLFSRKAKL